MNLQKVFCEIFTVNDNYQFIKLDRSLIDFNDECAVEKVISSFSN